MRASVAVISRNGENAFGTAVAMLDKLVQRQFEIVGIASPFESRTEKDFEKLRARSLTSDVVVGYICARTTGADGPQLVELENAVLAFDGKIYGSTRCLADIQVITEKLRQKPEEMAEALVKEVEGDFTFAIAKPEGLVAGRDPIGTHPLYYGENENWVALASERKALWKIGIDKTQSFPPGHVAIADRNGFDFKPVKAIEQTELRHISMHKAAIQLQRILQHSIAKRVSGLKEVAVAFSGGLDSSLIAFLARDSKAHVHLIHASLQNQKETEHARRVAETLELPLHVRIFTEEDVKKAVPQTIWLTEEPDPVKVSIGIPLSYVAEKAAELGITVALAGQGADELFGGYRRYVDEYASEGSKKVRETMFKDVVSIHETDLERDFKIFNSHHVELRPPFVAYEMVEFALGLPLRLKIGSKTDMLRKLVLRHVARNLDLPQSVTRRPKKAVQYATGVNSCLRKIARQSGLTVKDYLEQAFQLVRQKLIQHE